MLAPKSQQQYLKSLLKSTDPMTARLMNEQLTARDAKYKTAIEEGTVSFSPEPHEQQSHPTLSQPKKQFLSEEDHREAVLALLKQKKQLKMVKQKRRQQSLEKIKEQEEERRRNEEKERQAREEQKRKQLEQRVKHMEVQRQRRKSQAEMQKKLLQNIKHQVTLEEKLVKEYQKQELSLLEERKKRLAQIRELHKPISKEQLLEHERRFTEKKQQQKKELSQGGSSTGLRSYRSASVSNVYKSIWYKKVENEDPAKNELEKIQENIEKTKELKKKLKDYADYIKSNFKPELDEKKVQELRERLNARKSILDEIPVEEKKRIGMEYLKFSKEHINPNRIKDKEMLMSEQNQRQKPKDYLQEMRIERSASTRLHHRNKSENLATLLKDQHVDPHVKAKRVMAEVEKLDQKVRRKEKEARVKQDHNASEEVDDTYVKAIRKKLALLNSKTEGRFE